MKTHPKTHQERPAFQRLEHGSGRLPEGDVAASLSRAVRVWALLSPVTGRALRGPGAVPRFAPTAAARLGVAHGTLRGVGATDVPRPWACWARAVISGVPAGVGGRTGGQSEGGRRLPPQRPRRCRRRPLAGAWPLRFVPPTGLRPRTSGRRPVQLA